MFKNIKNRVDNINAQRKYIDADLSQDKDKALLAFYVKIMPQLLDAERCSIFIHDPTTDEVWLKCGTGVPEGKIQVPKDDSIVGEVIKTGQPQIVTDLEEKSGIHKRVDEETGFVTRDILCIPIKTLDGENVAGAVQILNKKNGNAFNDNDKKMLEEMAHFLQLTIESIYINQEAAGVLKNVFDLIRKIILVTITIFILVCASLAIYWITLYIAA